MEAQGAPVGEENSLLVAFLFGPKAETPTEWLITPALLAGDNCYVCVDSIEIQSALLISLLLHSIEKADRSAGWVVPEESPERVQVEFPHEKLCCRY